MITPSFIGLASRRSQSLSKAPCIRPNGARRKAGDPGTGQGRRAHADARIRVRRWRRGRRAPAAAVRRRPARKRRTTGRRRPAGRRHPRRGHRHGSSRPRSADSTAGSRRATRPAGDAAVDQRVEAPLTAAVRIDHPDAHGAGPLMPAFRHIHDAVECNALPVGRAGRVRRLSVSRTRCPEPSAFTTTMSPLSRTVQPRRQARCRRGTTAAETTVPPGSPRDWDRSGGLGGRESRAPADPRLGDVEEQ